MGGPAVRTIKRGEGEGVTLTRGNKLALAAFFVFLVLAVVGSVVRLPYAIMSPGPTVDTLGTQGGSEGGGKSLIVVDGLPSYPTSGALRFTTVRVEGGPGFPVNVWDVVTAWADPTYDVFPVEALFDPDQTQDQVAEENAVQMEGSQEEATAVALRAIGKPVPTHIEVAEVTADSKAKGLLEKGDRFEQVGDSRVTTAQSVRDALQTVAPGEPIWVQVRRDREVVKVEVPTIAGQSGRTALGVLLALEHEFPAEVTINAGAVGGPSAGLMFALGIYDKLTPGPLTGNRQVAGTGTIDEAGEVGPIGGIKQKLSGARADGAEFFLAPAGNCNEVVGNIPDGLEVFKVGTFAEARTAVDGIGTGQVSGLPRC